MQKKILFLTLKVFSATGGIEKVCRIAGKALNELTIGRDKLNIFSLHDSSDSKNKYFPSKIFSGFNNNKLNFVIQSIRQGVKNKIVFLSHINLLSIGYYIKLFSPKTKLVLFAHGIEVWASLSSSKKKMLKKCDVILPVSNYTKNKMHELYNLPEEKFIVVNNCLDPYLVEPNLSFDKSSLLKKYGLTIDNFIFITITRISADEQYKGHDKIIRSLKNLVVEFPNIKYVIAGKCDLSEKERLSKLIDDLDLNKYIIFTGFILDEEMASYYSFADVFIMPSTHEGFGIVFIEAMYYNLPVIAGNKDGSTDALQNGKLGMLVDPEDQKALTGAMKFSIINKEQIFPDRGILIKKFSYTTYKNNFSKVISKLYN